MKIIRLLGALLILVGVMLLAARLHAQEGHLDTTTKGGRMYYRFEPVLYTNWVTAWAEWVERKKAKVEYQTNFIVSNLYLHVWWKCTDQTIRLDSTNLPGTGEMRVLTNNNPYHD